jgi:hypothetical protein
MVTAREFFSRSSQDLAHFLFGYAVIVEVRQIGLWIVPEAQLHCAILSARKLLASLLRSDPPFKPRAKPSDRRSSQSSCNQRRARRHFAQPQAAKRISAAAASTKVFAPKENVHVLGRYPQGDGLSANQRISDLRLVQSASDPLEAIGYFVEGHQVALPDAGGSVP